MESNNSKGLATSSLATTTSSTTNGPQSKETPSCETASKSKVNNSPALPPHHHIRGDDTHENAESSGHVRESIKSSHRYYSTSSDQIAPSWYSRLVAACPIKTMLSYALYVVLVFVCLVLSVVVVLVAYYMLMPYFNEVPVLIEPSK